MALIYTLKDRISPKKIEEIKMNKGCSTSQVC